MSGQLRGPIQLAALDVPLPRGKLWASNLTRWLAPPGKRSGARILPPAALLLVWLIWAIPAVEFAMWLLDAPATALAGALPFWIVDAFNELTDFGKSGWFLIPIGIAIVLAAALVTPSTDRMTDRVLTSLIVRLEFIFAAIALPSLFVTIVKRLIGRVRPSEHGPFAYVPWSWRPEYASMPSGHATTAVAAAVAISLVWPRARVVMAVYAVIIMASRVIIQAHFLSDVIAAAFVGALGAILVRNAFAAHGRVFVPGADGTAQVKPGPSWRRLKAVAARLTGR